jgi:hypothetical protein
MRSLHLLQRATAVIAMAGALAFGPAAHANTLDTSTWLNGFINLSVHRSGGNQAVSAGGFTGTWHSGTPDVATPIAFWCFELGQDFHLGSSYPNYNPSSLGGTVGTRIAQLYEEAFGSAASSTINSAAFQLAVWEIEYDTDLNVLTGSGFNSTGGGASGDAARTQANIWLTGLGGFTGSTWAITRLSNTERQDFIVGNLPPEKCCKNDVPEPPVLPLVLAAMGAVALIESRRRLRSRGD